ncbi:NAD-dependent malic enzyme [Pengzhenrongella sicca]|uniref:Putative malate oxidoreductase [NAD] n=1 Tax=Pengzhenrongella sicca TaxID=2819238 RepID=A0A8A4Z8N8_9MICO|nr:NAD-dependent malic enzyme [Pengzhenrongella sicca]QTE28214.1 NAD-dependent malic enzyme [Pengzhenrongella sicca]
MPTIVPSPPATASTERLLHDPLLARGTAFTPAERTALGLHGLIPPAVEDLQQQVDRAYVSFRAQNTDIRRHINVRALQDSNEVVFYELIRQHVGELLPIVYTPTVGEACERFSAIYRRPRGLFVSYLQRGHLREVLRNRPRRDVDVVVVTDGQRILGLGDQGIGGLGIPIGKLSLYTALGGIDPARTLPIVLDVGTDNADRLADPAYLGWRHHRVGGADYDAFVDEFVEAVRAELPDVLLQWEDFATEHALPLLERYRERLLTFNDDIQGTAAVVVAALTAACVATSSAVRDQRIVMVGAGSAGVGVCEQIVRTMIAQGDTDAQARARIQVVDAVGLLTDDRTDLSPAQRRLAQPAAAVRAWWPADGAPDLLAVVQHARPTALLGLSTAAGAFTEAVVRAMAGAARRPIIMPLSNPTSHSEADPQDLADWTGGAALVATGSPFPPMRTARGEVAVAQCNNIYVFPAIGLAAVAIGARRITDPMLTAAADAIARNATIHTDPRGAVLPALDRLADVAIDVAIAVATAAIADGSADPRSPEDIERLVRAARWLPGYPPLT